MFMVNMLVTADPESSLGTELTMREVLDTAALTVGSDLADHPGVHATIRMALSNTYLGLGDLEAALLHAREMVQVTTESLGEDHSMTADAKSTLALVLTELGEYNEAESLLLEADEVIKELDDPMESAKLKNALARIYHMRGQHDRSLAAWEEAGTKQQRNTDLDAQPGRGAQGHRSAHRKRNAYARSCRSSSRGVRT